MSNTGINENRPAIRSVEELRDFLKGIRKLDRRINILHSRVLSLDDDAKRITTLYGGEVVSRTRNVHSREDVIAEKVDIERAMNAAIDDLIERKKYARELFELSGNANYEETLILHYLDYLSWSEIAEKMFCGKSTANHWHSEGLKAIVKIKNSEKSV